MLWMCICWFVIGINNIRPHSRVTYRVLEESRATLVWKAILHLPQITTDSLHCLPSPPIQWNVTCVGDEILLNKPRQRHLKLSINTADLGSY